jgi:hypothetical protein
LVVGSEPSFDLSNSCSSVIWIAAKMTEVSPGQQVSMQLAFRELTYVVSAVDKYSPFLC